MHSGYTLGMKTAISIPDPVFEEAERLAERMGKSRSQLYSEAVADYLARHDAEGVTERLNRVCTEPGSEPEPWLAEAGRRVLTGKTLAGEEDGW